MPVNNPTFITPRTTLQAVNELMAAARLAPLHSLEAQATSPHAADALRSLSTASRDIQLEKWHFNTDEDVPWQPNQEGNIVVPVNVVRFVLAAQSRHMDCTERAGKLYDRRAHTYTFTGTVYVNTTTLFDYEECPEAIRRLIVCTAGLEFVTEKAPGTQNYRFTASLLEKARTEAEGAEKESHGKPLPGSSPHFAKMRRK